MGLIQLSYQNDKIKDIDAESKKDSFTQDYKLKYQGHVYSPRLLMYGIGGSFREEDSETDESRVGRTTTTAKSRDYNLKLDFIQGTKYPFTIFKEKLDLPTWTIQPEQIFQTKQTIDRYGLFGSAFLGKGINLRYDMQEDNINTTSLTEVTDQTNRSFMLGINKRKGEDFIDAAYTYRHTFGKLFEAINAASISIGLKPGIPTNFNMNISYNDNSFTEFTTAISDINFIYMPSSDFNSNFSLHANHIEQKQDKGNSATFFGNSTYRLSQSLTTNQNLMLYKSEGDFSNESIESLTLGLVFAKQMPKYITVSADTSITGTAQQLETSKNRNSMSYSIGGMVSKFFDKINSEINGGGSCYFYRSSLKEKTERYTFNTGFVSRFIQNMTLQSLLNYSEEGITGDELDGTSSITKTKRLTSDNSIGYFMQIGFRGSLDAKTGAILESGTTSRTFRYANLTFHYSVRRSLSLNAGMNFYKESLNNTRTILGSLGAEYRLRGITMNFKNELWKEKGPQGTRTRSTTFLQASRPF
ncbi:MAG: hypothetical protein HY752_08830 [Nitrospirae bacterium]|nr:hypothetical protein [Nitrospirota bacterium]